ncbi:magnesium protoporphyrin IX methyltransferase [uncultured Roseovarius sp.]|uniref:magnesium protoporphyrin IX methyltransferase n=1 Tax=uncultured Roseovarius sp. TaxID=293344 RepID=UPI002618EA21|nr:magnesium protoporphyrin IX methyltransferase [uncultured Roseovarius sp.]
MSYDRTLASVETYFDKTATRTWERLTSDAPVSKIRETVRRGRDEMRALLLSRLPDDLTGARILDAGCGAGQMTSELATRGARVVGVDISPSLIDIAQKRLPINLHSRVDFCIGDMSDPSLGKFDYVIAMDSLIYYSGADIAQVLGAIGARTSGHVNFTVAPRTPLLMAMWRLGQLFPRTDRSPTMVPHAPARLNRALLQSEIRGDLKALRRVSLGFYISQAMEFTP